MNICFSIIIPSSLGGVTRRYFPSFPQEGDTIQEFTIRENYPLPHKKLVKIIIAIFECILVYFPNNIYFTQGIRILLLYNLNFSMISSIFL